MATAASSSSSSSNSIVPLHFRSAYTAAAPPLCCHFTIDEIVPTPLLLRLLRATITKVPLHIGSFGRRKGVSIADLVHISFGSLDLFFDLVSNLEFWIWFSISVWTYVAGFAYALL